MKVTQVRLKSMVPLGGRQVNSLGANDSFEASVDDGLLTLTQRTGGQVYRAAVPLSEVHCIVFETVPEAPPPPAPSWAGRGIQVDPDDYLERRFAPKDADGLSALEREELDEEPSDLETLEERVAASPNPLDLEGIDVPATPAPKKKRGKK